MEAGFAIAMCLVANELTGLCLQLLRDGGVRSSGKRSGACVDVEKQPTAFLEALG